MGYNMAIFNCKYKLHQTGKDALFSAHSHIINWQTIFHIVCFADLVFILVKTWMEKCSALRKTCQAFFEKHSSTSLPLYGTHLRSTDQQPKFGNIVEQNSP